MPRGSGRDTPGGMSNYLSIAEAVLREARQPLSARQMMRRAFLLELVPSGLYGRTQYKTLHARIAEDILARRNHSEFVRTEPGRFFLRSLLEDPTIPETFKREFPSPPRSDQLRNFYAFCISESSARGLVAPIWVSPSVSILHRLNGRFRSLSKANDSKEYIHLRTFVMLHRNREVFARRRARAFGDPLSGPSSLGVQGYLKADDRNLFSRDEYGLFDAAYRTMYQQLYMTHDVVNFAARSEPWRFYGLLFDGSDRRYRRALAAVILFNCSDKFDPVARFGPSEAFYWHSVDDRPNDISQFDPWSRYLIDSGHLSNAISQ